MVACLLDNSKTLAKKSNILLKWPGKFVYMTAKPKMQWGPGKMKRVSVRKKWSEKEGQCYTPIYVTFF